MSDSILDEYQYEYVCIRVTQHIINKCLYKFGNENDINHHGDLKVEEVDEHAEGEEAVRIQHVRFEDYTHNVLEVVDAGLQQDARKNCIHFVSCKSNLLLCTTYAHYRYYLKKHISSNNVSKNVKNKLKDKEKDSIRKKIVKK